MWEIGRSERGGVQVKVSIPVLANLLVLTVLFTMACTSPAPDGPHELVITISGQQGNASVSHEKVVDTLVSREACMTAMKVMVERPHVNPDVKTVRRTADSRTDTAGEYTVTAAFQCRLNMAAKPLPFTETSGTPSTPAAPEPTAPQPVVTPSAPPTTTQTDDEAGERVYRELLKIERERTGR
jgi:hypothetical protein